MRGAKPVDPLRETVTDLVPHVRDTVAGDGWQWSPIKGDGGRGSTAPLRSDRAGGTAAAGEAVTTTAPTPPDDAPGDSERSG